MTQQIIVAGSVDKDGRKLTGTGFDVTRETDKGHYTIEFTGDIGSVDGFTATQIYPDDGSTLDNVVIISLGRTKALIKTGNGKGEGEFRSFSFIAVATA